MAEELGRRQMNRLATSQAIREASERLFAANGFDGTTVRDIAEAAGVTERTFFRYFASKEELVHDQVMAWIPVLQDRIRRRPPGEHPLTAVKKALVRVDKQMAAASQPAPLWLFSDGPPAGRFSKSNPTVLIKAETALAEVIRERLAPSDAVETEDIDYVADVYARTALALIRSVMIRDWQLRTTGQRRRPSLATLVEQAFSAVQAR